MAPNAPCEKPNAPQLEIHQRTWIWGVYLALFAISVPWYLPPTSNPPLWFGVPYWVVMSLIGTIGIACFTVFVITRYWPDDEERS